MKAITESPEGPIPEGVRQFDCPQRFLVLSDAHGHEGHRCPISGLRGPSEYLVDFSDFKKWPHGRCSCDDFDFQIEYYVRRRQEPMKSKCKHIRRAAAFMAWHVRHWRRKEKAAPPGGSAAPLE